MKMGNYKEKDLSITVNLPVNIVDQRCAPNDFTG
jgi:hypothetical protein